MSFTITTSLSPNYASAMQIFMPSWVRYAGAERIVVNQIDSDDWYEGTIARTCHIRNAIVAAAKRNTKLISLDADLFVLGDLAGGFSDQHPFSVARWPKINMGVLFFNTSIPFDWSAFLDPLVNEIRSRCRSPERYTPRPSGAFEAIDQNVWREHLHANESQVHKLDMNVWNFCYQPHEWAKMLEKHGAGIHIAHVKGRGKWHEGPIARKIEGLKHALPGKAL